MSRAPLPCPGQVYLLHMDTPYVGARRNPQAKRLGIVQHYLGWTGYDIEHRLEDHAAGRGARLMQVITQAGITFQLARTWPAGRTYERRLKNQKNARRLCPLCNPQAGSRMAKP